MDDSISMQDVICDPIFYSELSLMLKNTNPAHGNVAAQVRRQLQALMQEKTEEVLELYNQHLPELLADAFNRT